MTIDMKYPTPLPSTKGWGTGWPNCHPPLQQHPIFQGGVHAGIRELVDLLVAEIEDQGYVFEPGWSWGFGCRATKGGSGNTPSFHSWGLALDINAPENVFGAPEQSSDIATHNRWIVPLMARYGFFWLGPSIGDWMHFSFAGSPADANAMLAKARKDGLGMALSPEDRATLNAAKAFIDALKKAGKFNDAAGAGTRTGKAVVKVEAGSPTPGPVPAHQHNLIGKAE